MNGRDLVPLPPSRPPNPNLPYREDCWSEGETSALVDAWGDRYIELNRGNLRQKHWQEVADAVNSRPGAGRRPARTDVQCKNRIDTVKKKYKAEKAKNGGVGSQWPFFDRLDVLIGSSVTPSSGPTASKKRALSPPPLALPLPFNRKAGPLPVASVAAAAAAAAAAPARPMEVKREPKERPLASVSVDDMMLKRAAQAAAAAAAEKNDNDDDEEEEEDEVESGSPSGSSARSFRGLKRAKEEEGEGIRELARTITWFAEMYERVEAAKQRQMMELEKQRIEFAKELEFQRMQIFVDSQVQLEKLKRAKRSDPDNYL